MLHFLANSLIPFLILLFALAIMVGLAAMLFSIDLSKGEEIEDEVERQRHKRSD